MLFLPGRNTSLSEMAFDACSSGGGQPVAIISIFSRTILHICQLFTAFYIANGFLLSCWVSFFEEGGWHLLLSQGRIMNIAAQTMFYLYKILLDSIIYCFHNVSRSLKMREKWCWLI